MVYAVHPVARTPSAVRLFAVRQPAPPVRLPRHVLLPQVSARLQVFSVPLPAASAQQLPLFNVHRQAVSVRQAVYNVPLPAASARRQRPNAQRQRPSVPQVQLRRVLQVLPAHRVV